MLTIEFTRQARNEYIATGQWYEQQKAGLGGRFFDTIDEFIDRIAGDPTRYPVAVKNVHESIVGVFPYYVYYRVAADVAQIVGIIHASRDSDVILSRLKTE